MRNMIRIPALMALTLSLAVPALAQSTHDQHAAPAEAATAALAVDPAKADLLHQEFVAKTAELRGKLIARRAELETLLTTKPGDEAAVKKLTGDIAALRGQLFEQTTLFRIRFAKETGTPIRMTRGFGHMGGQGMDMCKGMMSGKGMMTGMDMGAMPGMNMPAPAKPADNAKTN